MRTNDRKGYGESIEGLHAKNLRYLETTFRKTNQVILRDSLLASSRNLRNVTYRLFALNPLFHVTNCIDEWF